MWLQVSIPQKVCFYTLLCPLELAGSEQLSGGRALQFCLALLTKHSAIVLCFKQNNEKKSRENSVDVGKHFFFFNQWICKFVQVFTLSWTFNWPLIHMAKLLLLRQELYCLITKVLASCVESRVKIIITKKVVIKCENGNDRT